MEREIQQYKPDPYNCCKKGYYDALWSSDHEAIDEICHARHDDKDVEQSVFGHLKAPLFR